ncbi:hypothetical protein F190043G2_04540 [Blautia caecimuris]|jgi:uncharacterized protein (UPF0335 family)
MHFDSYFRQFKSIVLYGSLQAEGGYDQKSIRKYLKMKGRENEKGSESCHTETV